MNDFYHLEDQYSMLEAQTLRRYGTITPESRELIKRIGLVFVFGYMSPFDIAYIYLVRYRGDLSTGKRRDDWGLVSETVEERRVNGYFMRETIPDVLKRCLQEELGLAHREMPPFFVNKGKPLFHDFDFSDAGNNLSHARACILWTHDSTRLPDGRINTQEINAAEYYPLDYILNGIKPKQLRETPSTFGILKALSAQGLFQSPGLTQLKWVGS